MIWRPVRRETARTLMRWLEKDEWRHVALSSRLREHSPNFIFGRNSGGRLWIRENGVQIAGALFISRFGVVLPVFDDEISDRRELEFLRKFVVSRQDGIFSVIGMENAVLEIERHLDRIPPDIQSYRMFTGDRPAGLQESPEAFPVIHRALPSDSEKLWHLEKAYQIEEVLRAGNRLNEVPARRHFTGTLRDQEIYYAELDGVPVAKAGTNARGLHYDQIGGVYVIPEYRNRGIARQVMNHLLKSISVQGRKTCLFVKDSNPPALSLYRHLGFRDRGTFRISYWTP